MERKGQKEERKGAKDEERGKKKESEHPDGIGKKREG